MDRRQPLPRLWLMTDERQGKGLWRAVKRLPRGSGIVFRHYGLPPDERLELFERLRSVARRKRLLLVAGGPPRTARQWRSDGWHGRSRACFLPALIHTASAHDLGEIRAAERAGAQLVFLSAAFPTRSHPGRRALGPLRFMILARQARIPVIALGGMDFRRARRLGGAIYGWAGIDAWS